MPSNLLASIDTQAAADSNQRHFLCSMHLVFLIHGLCGNATHLQSMEHSILSSFGGGTDEIHVHRAKTMSALATFDSLSENAHRVLDELLECLSKTKATHLSIVGYSMGGLIGRYLVGILEEGQAFSHVNPIVFATFATPHLGSEYPKRSMFGYAFNFIGSRVSGLCGKDLFRHSSVIDDLADPKQRYYKGLQRFKYLYLFANALNDRTVPFWTSYITNKSPFGRNADVKLFSKVPVLVDVKSSQVLQFKPKLEETFLKFWRRKFGGLMFKAAIPFLLLIITSVMGIITVVAFVRRNLPLNSRQTSGECILSRVGAALDESIEVSAGARQKAKQDTPRVSKKEGKFADLDSYGLPSPGNEGIVSSALASLDLSPRTQANIEALNRLPWRKFVARIFALSSHGEIVDRRNASQQGKQLMNFFGEVFAEKHTKMYQERAKL